MMHTYIRVLCYSLLVSLAGVGSASALDQCKDILQDGIMKVAKTTHRSTYEEFVYTQIAEKSFDEVKANSGLNLAVTDVLGAGFTQDKYSQAQRQVQNTLMRQLQTANYEQILLLDGDPEIIQAWSKCVADQGGGLTARFQKTGDSTGRTILFEVAYLKPRVGHWPDHVTLDTSIEHSGAEILSGAQCFVRGHVIYDGKPCPATIRLSNAQETLTWVVSTDRYTTTATLPARLHHRVTTAELFVVNLDDPAINLKHSVTTTFGHEVAGTLNLNHEQVEEGWTFVREGAHADVVIFFNGTASGSDEYCRDGKFTSVLPTSARYSYTYSNGSPYPLICGVKPAILYSRDYWPPDDEGAAPPITTAFQTALRRAREFHEVPMNR